MTLFGNSYLEWKKVCRHCIDKTLVVSLSLYQLFPFLCVHKHMIIFSCAALETGETESCGKKVVWNPDVCLHSISNLGRVKFVNAFWWRLWKFQITRRNKLFSLVQLKWEGKNRLTNKVLQLRIFLALASRCLCQKLSMPLDDSFYPQTCVACNAAEHNAGESKSRTPKDITYLFQPGG